jgi:hypothetical protein
MIFKNIFSFKKYNLIFLISYDGFKTLILKIKINYYNIFSNKNYFKNHFTSQFQIPS